MSQATAIARPLRDSRPHLAAPRLRAMPTALSHGGHGLFALLCGGVLLAGLIATLMLNTALAKGTLEVNALQRQSTTLRNDISNVSEQIARASSGPGLAKAASDLGMVRAPQRGFIDVTTGKVTGEAVAAGAGDAVSVITSPWRTSIPKPKAVQSQEAAQAAAAAKEAAAKAAAAAAAAKTAAPAATTPATPAAKPAPPAAKPATPAAKPATPKP